MRKNVLKKCYESKGIYGQLGILCDVREFLNARKHEFNFYWSEITLPEMFQDKNCVYAAENGSGQRIEIDNKDEFKNLFNI